MTESEKNTGSFSVPVTIPLLKVEGKTFLKPGRNRLSNSGTKEYQ